MKTKNKFLMLLCAATLCSALSADKAKAQTTYPVLAMEVQNEPLAGTDTSEMLSPDSLLFASQMVVSLYDTANISKLHVKLGRTYGSSDLLQKAFTFDHAGALGDGTSYVRNGYTIELGLGEYAGLLQFYTELVVEKADGSFTDPVVFTR